MYLRQCTAVPCCVLVSHKLQVPVHLQGDPDLLSDTVRVLAIAASDFRQLGCPGWGETVRNSLIFILVRLRWLGWPELDIAGMAIRETLLMQDGMPCPPSSVESGTRRGWRA